MAFDVKHMEDLGIAPKDIIGVRGGPAPRLCAVSGRDLARPYVTITLDGDYYCRVLAKFHNAQWNEERRAAIKGLINRAPKPLPHSGGAAPQEKKS